MAEAEAFMSRLVNLILAVGIPAVLIVAYFLVTHLLETQREARQEDREVIRLLAFEPDELSSITLAHGEENRVS